MASKNSNKAKQNPPVGVTLRSASAQRKQPLNSTTTDTNHDSAPEFSIQRSNSASSADSISSTIPPPRTVRTSEDDLALPGGIDKAINELHTAVEWFEYDFANTENWKNMLDAEHIQINESASRLFRNASLIGETADTSGGDRIAELQSRIDKAYNVLSQRKQQEIQKPPTI